MERDIDYFAGDSWEYQFAKYPRPNEQGAYAHDDAQKQAILAIISENRNAAQCGEPFSKGNLLAFGNLMIFAVFGEYKTDAAGDVKAAFDEMQGEWEKCFTRLARKYPTASELIVETSEAQSKFFHWWHCILDCFRYVDFVQYQAYEHNLCASNLNKYIAAANSLRKKLKSIALSGVDAHTYQKANGKRTLPTDARNTILDEWIKYKTGVADYLLPNGKYRTTKRHLMEFYERCGTNIIYTSPKDGALWTLKQLCHTVDELNTAIDSAQKAARRAKKKAARRKADK